MMVMVQWPVDFEVGDVAVGQVLPEAGVIMMVMVRQLYNSCVEGNRVALMQRPRLIVSMVSRGRYNGRHDW